MVNSDENEILPKTNNNGPRVSFNRDVHVKRYGSLQNNELLNYDSNLRPQSPNLRREYIDLTDAAALEREATLVLKQVNNFGSLPHPKQKLNLKKPLLRRSKSDASSSSKKSKRNSIFNFFNSSLPITQLTISPPVTNLISKDNNDNNLTKKFNTHERSLVKKIDNNKKVKRSKSDISNMKKREKYNSSFQSNSNSFNANQTSSDSSDNNNSHLKHSYKTPLSPISEVNTPLDLETNNLNDYFSRKVTPNTCDSFDFKSCENIAQTPVDSKSFSKSMESLHSSQMPVEKPRLTKNLKVDKMVKRLSIERLSPPPITVLQAGGFSYTNPILSPINQITISQSFNEIKANSPPRNKNNIFCTQLAYNEIDADENKAIHSLTTVQDTQKSKNRESASPTLIQNLSTNEFNNQFTNLAQTSLDYPDRDEADNNALAVAPDNDEPIKPNIREQIPRYSSNSNFDHINNFYLDNEFDRLHEMREKDFFGIDASLSNRREILESRINSRIGGLHQINKEHQHTRSNAHPPTTKKKQQHQRYNTHKYDSNEIVNSYTPERKQHHEFTRMPSKTLKHNQSNKMINLDNSSMRKNTYVYNEKTTDSGNETDNVTRNNSENRRHSSRFNIGRKWNYEDDIIECELFLMKERKHTEETYPYQLVRTYVYRQHTNDDDQYDTDRDKKDILKEWKHNKKITREFLKSQKKKKSGLDKVKELFKSKKSNDKNEENELKLRYREYSPEKIDPPKKSSAHQSIVHRRRLSTPQASPIISNRSKSLPPKIVNPHQNNVSSSGSLKPNKNNNAQKFNWFASLDRLSRQKNRDSDVSTLNNRKVSIARSKSSSMKNISNSYKTLRFFGDTDADENDLIRRYRSPNENREKSSSLQNLNSSRKSKQSKSISRSRQELLNIAESTSDEQNAIDNLKVSSRPMSPLIYNKFVPPPRPPKSSKLVNSVPSTLPKVPQRKQIGRNFYDDEEISSFIENQDSIHSYEKKNDFESDTIFSTPRRLRESLSVSRENLNRDRFDSDASQRSVVYLHASVVGDIPSQTLGRKMSDKSSVKTANQEEQPITRTVSRSFSLAAPWKPKFINDGYEINYNNDQQKNIN